MKSKKIGNSIGIGLGTVYIAVVLYLEATKKLDWKTLLILFLFFVVWGIIVFANLAAFFENKEISVLGIKIASTHDKLKAPNTESSNESIHNQLNKLDEKIKKLELNMRDMKQTLVSPDKRDFHKEFEQFKLTQSSFNIMFLEKYESPKRLKEFVKLVEEARVSKYDLLNDITYQELVEDYRKNIIIQLSTVLEEIAKNNVFTNLQETFADAVNSDSINQETFDTVKKRLIMDNDNNKLEIISTFSKAINDLKKLK
ncbi:hypothetical protein [Limosilactobacillus albertensis]|uniref:Uncharacterized protein n=1 Tax=Limosilactobacillus albertensis TaxID=2759752 RepID=A0A839HBF9_9LACO|nr:hypothetical protein [Limosilactobacillus albertensis]MBB1123292.1 hypothetical protein [Limosilactobacillus albertensis]MCD7121296.1 hypothetical protein [Limosilactobacillus albertensis]